MLQTGSIGSEKSNWFSLIMVDRNPSDLSNQLPFFFLWMVHPYSSTFCWLFTRWVREITDSGNISSSVSGEPTENWWPKPIPTTLVTSSDVMTLCLSQHYLQLCESSAAVWPEYRKRQQLFRQVKYLYALFSPTRALLPYPLNARCTSSGWVKTRHLHPGFENIVIFVV